MTIDAERPAAGEPRSPLIDASRRRLVLPRHLVPVALLLRERRHRGNFVELERELMELERAGIVDGGALHPLAEEILDPIALPRVIVTVEISEKETVRIATIWRRGTAATIGTSEDGKWFELDPVEVGLLVFHLAALTSLTARPSTTAEPFIVDVGTAASLWRKEFVPRVQPPGGPAGELFTRLRAAAQRQWRLSTLWCDTEGSVGDGMVEVIDAADLGYWQVTPIPGGMAVVTPRPLEAVLRLLADALPQV